MLWVWWAVVGVGGCWWALAGVACQRSVWRSQEVERRNGAIKMTMTATLVEVIAM